MDRRHHANECLIGFTHAFPKSNQQPARTRGELAKREHANVLPPKQRQSGSATRLFGHPKQPRRSSRHDELHGHQRRRPRAILLSRRRPVTLAAVPSPSPLLGERVGVSWFVAPIRFSAFSL